MPRERRLLPAAMGQTVFVLARGLNPRGRGLDLAVSGAHEVEEPVRDEPGGYHSEKERAEGLLRQLLQSPVDADGLLWVVLERGADEEHADEPGDDRLGEIADDSRTRRPFLRAGRHLLGAEVVLELLRQAAVRAPH